MASTKGLVERRALVGSDELAAGVVPGTTGLGMVVEMRMVVEWRRGSFQATELGEARDGQLFEEDGCLRDGYIRDHRNPVFPDGR